MAADGLSWRNAHIPDGTALFAIGDIHAHDRLLSTLLAALERELAALPADIHAHIVFVGDYIDRGPNVIRTLDILVDFEQRMAEMPQVSTHFLCGNHDEIFKRFLRVTGVAEENVGDVAQRDFTHLTTRADGSIYLKGFESWFFRGSGYTTVKSYIPELDESLIDHDNKCFKRGHADFSSEYILDILHQLAGRVPAVHQEFLRRIADNSHIILGDYVLTHAAVDPEKSLMDQGIGQGARPLTQHEYIDFLMLRDEFLWRDDLPNCPYIVVHGHTPSAIMDKDDGHIIADGQKDYRLNIDTCVYAPNGALTMMIHTPFKREFVAVNKGMVDGIKRYSL